MVEIAGFGCSAESLRGFGFQGRVLRSCEGIWGENPGFGEFEEKSEGVWGRSCAFCEFWEKCEEIRV